MIATEYVSPTVTDNPATIAVWKDAATRVDEFLHYSLDTKRFRRIAIINSHWLKNWKRFKTSPSEEVLILDHPQDVLKLREPVVDACVGKGNMSVLFCFSDDDDSLSKYLRDNHYSNVGYVNLGSGEPNDPFMGTSRDSLTFLRYATDLKSRNDETVICTFLHDADSLYVLR